MKEDLLRAAEDILPTRSGYFFLMEDGAGRVLALGVNGWEWGEPLRFHSELQALKALVSNYPDCPEDIEMFFCNPHGSKRVTLLPFITSLEADQQFVVADHTFREVNYMRMETGRAGSDLNKATLCSPKTVHGFLSGGRKAYPVEVEYTPTYTKIRLRLND